MSTQLMLLVVIATTFCVIAADHEDIDKRRFIRKNRDAHETDSVSDSDLDANGDADADVDLDKRRFIRKSRGFDDEHYDAAMEKRRFIRKSRANGLDDEDEASVDKRRFIRKSRHTLDVNKRRFIRKSRSLQSVEDEHTPAKSLIEAQGCLQSLVSNCSCERALASDQPLTCSCPNTLPTHCQLERCCSLKSLPDSNLVNVVCNC